MPRSASTAGLLARLFSLRTAHASRQFNKSGASIRQQLDGETHGKGVLALELSEESWKVSDDTVMHLATAEGLITAWQQVSLL